MQDSPQISLPDYVFEHTDTQHILDNARSLGFWPWLHRHSQYNIPSLFAVFGISLPQSLGLDSDDLLPLLHRAFVAKASRRTRLTAHSSIADAVSLIRHSRLFFVTQKTSWCSPVLDAACRAGSRISGRRTVLCVELRHILQAARVQSVRPTGNV